MVQLTPQAIVFSIAAAMATLGGVFFAAAYSNGFVLTADNVASTLISKRRKRATSAAAAPLSAPHVPMERALLRGMDILDKGLDRIRDRDMIALQQQCLALGKGSPWVLCKQAFQFVQKFSEMEIEFVFRADERRATGDEFIAFSQLKRRNICMMEWHILSNATCACDDEQRQRQLALLDLAVRLEDMDHLKSQYHMAMVQLDIDTFSPDECVLCISVSARLGYWKDLIAIWSRLDKIDPQIRWQIYHLWREQGVADYSVICKILCEPRTCVPAFSPDPSLPSSYREAIVMRDTKRPEERPKEALEFSQWSATHVHKRPVPPHTEGATSPHVEGATSLHAEGTTSTSLYPEGTATSPAPSPVRSDKRLTSTNTSRTLDFSSSSASGALLATPVGSSGQGGALLATPVGSSGQGGALLSTPTGSSGRNGALLSTPLSARSIAAMSPSRYHVLRSPSSRPEDTEPSWFEDTEPSSSSSNGSMDKGACIRIEGHLCFLYGIGELHMLTGFFYADRIYAKGSRHGGASSRSGSRSGCGSGSGPGDTHGIHETVSLIRHSTTDEGGVRVSDWSGVYVHSREGTAHLEIRFEVPPDEVPQFPQNGFF